MRIATTPTHYYSLPVDASMVKYLRLTYKQFGETILEKTEQDVTVDGYECSCKLTQQETLLFKPCCTARAQVRIVTTDCDVFTSDEVIITVEDSFNKEVLE